jgi:hypothetical protein
MTNARSVRGSRRLSCVLSLSILTLASAAALLGSATAWSADATSEKFGDLNQAITDLRAEAGHDRRAIVKANMLLTASEGTIFWPLYDEYRAERVALADRRQKMVFDFLAKRDTMTQDEAEDLTKEAFSKVLSARTVARFIQIDSKLDTIADVVVAAQVPLIH